MAGHIIGVDVGGTFTDVVAVAPDGTRHVRKALSDDTRHGRDAAVEVIRSRVGGEASSTSITGMSSRMG